MKKEERKEIESLFDEKLKVMTWTLSTLQNDVEMLGRYLKRLQENYE